MIALLRVTPFFLLCLFLFSSAVNADTPQQEQILIETEQVLEELQNSPEQQVPVDIFSKAKAIIVFPTMIKGGFIFAARYGKGVAVIRNAETGKWGPPAFLVTYGLSWGLQIGGEAVDLVLLVMTERGIKGLLSSKFTLGADAAISAGPVGRHAEAGTDATFKGEIYSYSRSKGLFAGISLKGAVLNEDADANWEYYQQPLTPEQIMLDGQVKQFPESTKRFMNRMNEIAPVIADSPTQNPNIEPQKNSPTKPEDCSPPGNDNGDDRKECGLRLIGQGRSGKM
jgi:lipid-binding SYLF domain-containing protein